MSNGLPQHQILNSYRRFIVVAVASVGIGLLGNLGNLSPALAQTASLTTIHSFSKSDGANPYAVQPIQASDGNFYGTTALGGSSSNCSSGCGTVFRLTPGGSLTTLYSFNKSDGYYPASGLIQASDGNFYGTTYIGGSSSNCSSGCGTVFRLTPGGSLTTLHSFNKSDGTGVWAKLIQASDGNLYGTTLFGGSSSNCSSGCGTVFRLTTNGVFTVLHSFNGSDGSLPYASLVQTSDSNLYGTTYNGGTSSNCTNGCGTAFRVTTTGSLTTLHSFNKSDGANPYSSLLPYDDGNFYGTTFYGGASSNCGTLGCGTIFQLTPNGNLTTLHSFNGGDGRGVYAGLTRTYVNGYLYGTTYQGGANLNSYCSGGCGTIFSFTPDSRVLTTLHSFIKSDGYGPLGQLFQDKNGLFYGTTYYGGTYGYGTVFRISDPILPPPPPNL